jgi:hypothetical protein
MYLSLSLCLSVHLFLVLSFLNNGFPHLLRGVWKWLLLSSSFNDFPQVLWQPEEWVSFLLLMLHQWFSSCFEKILNQKWFLLSSFFNDFAQINMLQLEECISFFLMLFHHDYPHVLRRALNQKAVAPLIPFKCFSSHFEKSSESVALYMKFGFFWWLIWGWQIKMELEIVKGGKLKHVLVEAACSHRASKLILGTKWHFSIWSVPHSILCYFSNLRNPATYELLLFNAISWW